jgi:Rrf2 family protein
MLRLSREADYSLLAMMYIAARPAGQLAYRREIAAHYNIPKEFLAKVLQKLTRHGLIKSFRGMQGGYLLARDAGRITLGDVVQAVDGPVTLVTCQREGGRCPQEELCTVQGALLEVQREFQRILSGITLEDAGRRSARKAECESDVLTLEAAPR